MTNKSDAATNADASQKFCRACGIFHATTAFYSDRSRSDGLTRYCKAQDTARRVARARRSRAKARAAASFKEHHERT